MRSNGFGFSYFFSSRKYKYGFRSPSEVTLSDLSHNGCENVLSRFLSIPFNFVADSNGACGSRGNLQSK